jgi:hypothetical protein
MGIHVWAAALDALGQWMQGPEDDDNQTASTVEDTEFPPWEDDADENADEEWTWEPPNLRENQPWYRDRVESLKKAIQGLPDPKILREEGLRALDQHRTNYSNDGPKCMQLLWWEFPAEHWKDIREGSSMNFLIKPRGSWS